MFSGKKLPQVGLKTILVKNIFTQTHLTVLNIKNNNCIGKLSVVKQLSLDITRFFQEHCSISEANIQHCNIAI